VKKSTGSPSDPKLFNRAAGILLHPTSLPGRFGIGDLGPGACNFMDWLRESGCTLWQVLPLGPTGYADSPYQCFSAFAGNPLLVSPDLLLEAGLLQPDEVELPVDLDPARVDYGRLWQQRPALLAKAARRLLAGFSAEQSARFEAFQAQQSAWLAEFSLFMALKTHYGGRPWTEWDQDLVQRKPAALKRARKELAEQIQIQAAIQFFFFWQWGQIKQYAVERGLKIIGDIPIFVAHDSVDVWVDQHLFMLDERGFPTVVAGVPPDYFSPTGQRWGNPLYRWDVLENRDYAWWMRRLEAVLTHVDYVRMDHFRGFESYWEVPAEEPTAEKGRWVSGPGSDLFYAMQAKFGHLPIIAEDLGLITDAVIQLRETFDFPGMKVLQFAFDGDNQHPYLPHNYPQNCIAYTGTHDNDTTVGWYRAAPERERDFYRRYFRVPGDDVAWDFIRAVWASNAVWAIAPMQDLLCLETHARMNLPGTAAGNWTWRVTGPQLQHSIQDGLRHLNQLHNRAG